MILSINGEKRQVEVEDTMPLLWVLRDVLDMTGTKYGCGISSCGACTVHIDGVAIQSCTYSASQALGKEITTIEGIGEASDGLSNIQKAWIQHQVPQCGYCQSGMVMAAEALLAKVGEPTDDDIDQAIVNICRCGTYQRVRDAIHTAAQWNKESNQLLVL